MRDFRKLEVWKSGVEVVKEVYGLLNNFPSSEKFALSNQISRSVVSIPSNIAEGCSRDSQKEFSRFLQIALGSSFELETQLIISKELGYFDDKSLGIIKTKLNKLQKGVHALKKYTDSKTNNLKPNAK